MAITDLDKAEAFKQHLSEIFVPHSDIYSPQNVNTVEEFLNAPLPTCSPVKHFTPNELKYTIDKYPPPNKSPGFDLITADVARCLPKKAIVHLTHIFNPVLRLSYFPLIWKFSIIILVPKPNKPPDSTSSFRPISLLPFFAKILERLLLKRILPSVTSNSILPNSQFGFRNAHSTIHQAHRLVDSISFALEKKLYCICAFLDISQAFDRVWHDGLLYKLKKFLHPVYFLIIKSYLFDRHFSTRIGDTLSSIAKISAGVPQGYAPFSPLYCTIYMPQTTLSHPTLKSLTMLMIRYIIRKSPNQESVNSNLKTVEVQNTTAIALPSDHLKSENLKLQTSFIEHNDPALPLPSDRLERHSKLLKGPCQVHLSLYPRVKFGDQFRSFQKSWYETFKWLEYSESINAAFCFCCRAFSSNNIIKKGHIDQSFIKKGFTNWKGATEAFRLHEKSQCHIDSVISWKHLKKGIPIDVKLDKQKEITLAAREKIRLENQDIIKRLINVIIVLSKSGSSFRGHLEHENSVNKGLFLEIVDLLKQYDSIIKNHLEHGPKNAQYLSGKIQNELIASVHNVMFQEICKRLNGQQIAVWLMRPVTVVTLIKWQS
ncbi:hypothetical protein QTP88_019960 [Uroleucon formosanum]